MNAQERIMKILSSMTVDERLYPEKRSKEQHEELVNLFNEVRDRGETIVVPISMV